jgi:hypothetical protein
MPFTLVRKAAAALLVLMATGESWAQTTTSTATGTATTSVGALSQSDFTFYTEYYDPSQGIWVQMNDTQKAYFFNRARCECAGDQGDGSNWSGYFKIAVQPAATTPQKIQTLLTANRLPQGDAKFYAGANEINCLNINGYVGGVGGACTNLEHPTPDGYSQGFPLSNFETSRIVESDPIAVSTLFGSLSACGPKGNCNSVQPCATTGFQRQTIFFWVRSSGKATPDTTDLSFTLDLTGQIEFGPTDVSAEGGNQALTVSWGWEAGVPPSANSSFLGIQLFCQRAGSYQVFPDGTYGASYMQSAALCPAAAPVISSPSAFSNLSPRFLCSGLLPSTATSYRITGLQNEIWYGVSAAAVDKYGNASAIDPDLGVAYGKPVATVDFYSDYREAGGKAQGGFCSLAGWERRPGAMGLGLVALGLLALILMLRRSRKGPTGTALLVLLVAGGALVVAHPARAEEDAADTADDEPQPEEVTEKPALPAVWTGTERNFALELRFGLYTPNVDSEFGSSGQQPNALIFGNTRRPMWQVEFDWQILQKLGTLALGASVGYWKENGQACLASDLQATGQCTQTGDSTSLRLIPFALLLVYRMDEAATRWGIPLVPYAKLGLNYTIWTVNDGDGNVPEYPRGGRGQGGTAGWQAAVGLSLQLDFIDPAAAHEFDADAGVNHTYAFFELDHINGSGLYRSDVLRVGDSTWFAGLMFEF